MRIIIDLQACQSSSRFRGIGRYAMAVAQAIARNAGGHEIWLALSVYGENDIVPIRKSFQHARDEIISIRKSFQNLVPSERVVVFSIPGPLTGIDPQHAWRSRAAELVRWHALAELKPDIIYIASLFEGFGDNVTVSIEPVENGTPNAVTLYDLIPLNNQDEHLITHIHRSWYFNKLEYLKRAELLLAISEHTRKEAINLLKLQSDRVINISAGVSNFFYPLSLSADEISQLFMQYAITRPFLLYTGNLDANKNLKGTIQAYAMLPLSVRQMHQLVIISKMDAGSLLALKRYRAKCGLKDDEVVFTNYIPDEHLVMFYNLCKAFIFPSLHEGFGLPVLEAMSCGAACIGSGTTSIPEVIGRQDALFNPYNPEAIAKAIHNVLTDENFRQSLRKHALIQSRHFSWDESARRALHAFEGMFEQNSRKNSNPGASAVNSIFNGQTNYESLITKLSKINVGIEPTDDDIRQVADSIAINEVASCKKKLFVDVSTIILHDAKTGIQRVVRSILHHLLEKPPAGYEITPVYGDNTIGYYRYADKFRASLLGNNDFEGPEPVINYKRGDVFLGLDLSAHLFPLFTSVISNFRIIGVKVYFIVYDILPLLKHRWFVPGMHEAFTEWMKAISCHANSLVCISAAVADEVRNWIDRYPPKRPDKIKIGHFRLGADIGNSIPTAGLPENAKKLSPVFKSNPTFLMVGTIEPRKAHAQALAAFQHLWAKDVKVNLVIVGKAGWNMEHFIEQLQRHKEFNKKLYWLEGISDEYLIMLYKISSALIAASEAEGFGLPLVEAAQHKLPIIARDIAVFREVAGDHAYYFKGYEPTDLADAVTGWLELSKLGKAPQSFGMSWLTWEESTKLLLDSLLPHA